ADAPRLARACVQEPDAAGPEQRDRAVVGGRVERPDRQAEVEPEACFDHDVFDPPREELLTGPRVPDDERADTPSAVPRGHERHREATVAAHCEGRPRMPAEEGTLDRIQRLQTSKEET